MKKPNPADLLTETISIRISLEECRALVLRAQAEHRTLSQLARLLIRSALKSSEL